MHCIANYSGSNNIAIGKLSGVLQPNQGISENPEQSIFIGENTKPNAIIKPIKS